MWTQLLLLLQGVCNLQRTQAYRMALHYIYTFHALYNTNVDTPCMGSLTGHRRQRLAGQSQCGNVSFAILIAIPLTGSNLRGSLRFTRIYVSWYFHSFWANFFQTNFISSCKIRTHDVHFIKSDNQFYISRKRIKLLKHHLTSYWTSPLIQVVVSLHTV